MANGAQIIDVNMDEGMLDSQAAMAKFLSLIAGEPDIARVPVMIDSSKWSVIEAGLKCVQGKAHRQFHQPEGGRGGVSRRRRACVMRYGAAVVVMAFDEKGQADTIERKVSICERAYALLTERLGFAARGHHLRSEYLRRGHRHRGAQSLQPGFHRGHRGHQAAHARRCT